MYTYFIMVMINTHSVNTEPKLTHKLPSYHAGSESVSARKTVFSSYSPLGMEFA